MADPFVGEIRLFAGTFAPLNWMDCAGQLVAISQYDTLFALIGTTYGGDGVNTFALPDLRGRAPLHTGTRNGGSTYVMGQAAGTENVTLSTQQLPTHTHQARTATGGQVASPANAIFATATSDQAGVRIYGTNTATTTNLAASSIQPMGGSQPHDNMQPFQVVRYIISMFGIFPSQG